VASHARINTCFLLLITELNEQKNLATLAFKKLSNLIVSKERQKNTNMIWPKGLCFPPIHPSIKK
jgi:hypothetical protein